jgi:hypothetical protein
MAAIMAANRCASSGGTSFFNDARKFDKVRC